MKKILLLFTLSFGLTLAHAQETTPKTEDKPEFPSLVLKDMDGKEVDLQKFAKSGKVTILSFWATWCAPCKKELENMNEVLEEWQEKYNVQLVAVSIDDARNAMKVKPYVNGKKWEFTVLLDVNQDAKRALNFPNVPYTVLIDKNGNIVYKHIGYTEGDEQVLEEKIAALK
ncbi:MAG: TlpA family protein disulfide reductase [Sphingobacteriales bacterium]|nr:MAG: TlpA family protein disulfide reductase [Sphingobacteriales bacterium]